MKPRKHKRKESFSVLLVSNTGQNSKQFHVSRSLLRLVIIFVLLVCAIFGWLMYQYLTGEQGIGGEWSISRGADETEEELLEKIAAQEELMQQLEEEKEALNSQNSALTAENKALLEAARTNMGTDQAEGDTAGEENESDDSGPSRYPYSEQGVVSVKYSTDHPYISIDTQEEGNVVAAGDGKISMIGSDADYPLIIEITHDGDYRTRYMFPQEAESLLEEGADVEIGDPIVTLDEQNVQLDYQVIFEDQPIDPLIVFEAKG